MREKYLLSDIRKAGFKIRSISARLTPHENFDAVFEQVKKSIKNWSEWTKFEFILTSEDFLRLESELLSVHKARLQADPTYRAFHFRCVRAKKRIIRDAGKLKTEQDLAKISYGLKVLRKRWRQTDNLFVPLEFRLWCDFKISIEPIERKLNECRDQVNEIRLRSASLRYELLQESKTLQRALSEAEAQSAVRRLIKKWKEIPRVDPFQEQRFWRWTEIGLESLFRKSG